MGNARSVANDAVLFFRNFDAKAYQRSAKKHYRGT